METQQSVLPPMPQNPITPNRFFASPSVTSNPQTLFLKKLVENITINGVVRLLDYREEIILLFWDKREWSSQRVVHMLTQHIPALQSTASFNSKIGTVLYFDTKAAILRAAVADQDKTTNISDFESKISSDDMKMLINCIPSNKRDIIRYVIAVLGGEDARAHYEIHTTTKVLKERVETLRVPYQTLQLASATRKDEENYISHKAPSISISNKHRGGQQAFEKKNPELIDEILNIVHDSGSMIHSSLNIDTATPHMTLRGMVKEVQRHTGLSPSKSAIQRAAMNSGKRRRKKQRASIAISFARTKKVQVKKHRHGPTIRKLWQSLRDFHIRNVQDFVSGRVIMLSYDDLALIAYNAIISNTSLWNDRRRPNKAPASDYASGSGLKLCISTHQILTPQIPTTNARQNGQREKVVRYNFDMLPFTERYKYEKSKLDGTLAKSFDDYGNEIFPIEVSDRSGPAVAIAKPFKKKTEWMDDTLGPEVLERWVSEKRVDFLHLERFVQHMRHHIVLKNIYCIVFERKTDCAFCCEYAHCPDSCDKQHVLCTMSTCSKEFVGPFRYSDRQVTECTPVCEPNLPCVHKVNSSYTEALTFLAEAKRVSCCSYCKSEGHNKRYCPQNPGAVPKKAARAQPRKRDRIAKHAKPTVVHIDIVDVSEKIDVSDNELEHDFSDSDGDDFPAEDIDSEYEPDYEDEMYDDHDF